MVKPQNPKLVILYQKMADMTAPECAGVCRCPHSCCDELACTMARQMAASQGVTLQEYPPNAKGAFYLGHNGCTVTPHLRPHCTLHTCEINGLGFKKGDLKWTKDYFSLRGKIERMEAKEKRW